MVSYKKLDSKCNNLEDNVASAILFTHSQMMQLKSRWNFVKTKTTTPGNNIYTLLITFVAFTSFISSKFQTLFFPYKLSYYAWATCGLHPVHRLPQPRFQGVSLLVGGAPPTRREKP